MGISTYPLRTHIRNQTDDLPLTERLLYLWVNVDIAVERKLPK